MAKAEWIKKTPRELYANGVNDAIVYAMVNRNVILPDQPMKKDFRFWAAGVVAQNYGVNLQPAGRS